MQYLRALALLLVIVGGVNWLLNFAFAQFDLVAAITGDAFGETNPILVEWMDILVGVGALALVPTLFRWMTAEGAATSRRSGPCRIGNRGPRRHRFGGRRLGPSRARCYADARSLIPHHAIAGERPASPAAYIGGRSNCQSRSAPAGATWAWGARGGTDGASEPTVEHGGRPQARFHMSGPRNRHCADMRTQGHRD